MAESQDDKGLLGHGRTLSGAYPADAQGLQQRLFAALADFNLAHERQPVEVVQTSPGVKKITLLKRLKQQRRSTGLSRSACQQARVLPDAWASYGITSTRILSAQETNILRSVISGACNSVIAAQAGLDDAAVRDHIKAILMKVRSESSGTAPWTK
jgi:ATP/maltotriose-dependent transcriptional regulator MalT